MTRIAHVSSAHSWTDNRIHFREAASLAAHGYDVALVARQSTVSVDPADGVTVYALPRMPRWRRMLFAGPMAIMKALRTRPQVFHLHDPELVWAVPLLRLLGRKVVYDAHEDLPLQIHGKSYLKGPLLPIAVLISHIVVRVAGGSHAIIAATESVAARFPRDKTYVVRNLPPLRIEEEVATDILKRPTACAFAGAISDSRNVRVMVESLSDPDFPCGWNLEIAGTPSSADLLESLKALQGWAKVTYHGQLPPDSARHLLLQTRVGLILSRPLRAQVEALPTKMFEYFAAGLPVITSDFPLRREILERYKCGMLVDPGDPADVARAVATYARNPELLADHSRNARRAAVEEFNWAREAETLAEVYSGLLSPQSTARA